MTEYTLTVLDTTGIQNYIFSSNRLKENIGASQLVKEVTGEWIRHTLVGLDVPINHQYEPIESSQLPAEIIYAGGGNAQIIFRERETAIEFTRRISLRVLKEARGIQLLAAHRQFTWGNGLRDAVNTAMKEDLDRYKQTRTPSSPLLGLSVTVNCNSSQLPAIGLSTKYNDDSDDPYPISEEIRLKHKASERAQTDLKIPDHLVFPKRIDKMGRTVHESSYIAIIHADGNSMGERFREYGRAADGDRDYILRMRSFSEQVDAAGKAALRNILNTIIEAIETPCNSEKAILQGKFNKFELAKPQENSPQHCLPFRPLVYGGDDVTFVCDGRLGIELAVAYLKELEKHTMLDGKKLTACAGVCLVKTHYPFARAYELSEALCNSGKDLLRESNHQGSAIDWHIANTGLFGSLADLRDHEYTVPSGSLNMRPLVLEATDDWKTWEIFLPILQAFNENNSQDSDKNKWRGKRNKIMALREVLRKGPGETKQFLHGYHLDRLPKIESTRGYQDSLETTGWVNQTCGYFDAIEAMDFYTGLGEQE
jgi:hypothetical protein